MKDLTLKSRFWVYYFYYFPLLNHFLNHNQVYLPFFLLHDIEAIVVDVKDRKIKENNYTILHQGLIIILYNFHLSLSPLFSIINN